MTPVLAFIVFGLTAYLLGLFQLLSYSFIKELLNNEENKMNLFKK